MAHLLKIMAHPVKPKANFYSNGKIFNIRNELLLSIRRLAFDSTTTSKHIHHQCLKTGVPKVLLFWDNKCL